MSFTELLRSSRSSRISVLHKFLTNYDPQTSRVYGFVEGDADQAFYRAHIQKYVPKARDIYIYNCGGKDKVYQAYQDIIARYPNCVRTLFFVDKDLDDIIGRQWPSDPRIFTTSYYAVENYVVCREALAHYFQDFVKVRHIDIQIEAVLAEFEEALKTFYRLILPLMGWIVVARRAGSHVRLNDVNLGELFTICDAGIYRKPRRCSLSYLKRVTQVSNTGAVWRQVRAVCDELSRLPPKSYVRGKFEAWWFIEFARRISEGLQRVAAEANGSVSLSVQLTHSNFIQLLSPRLAVPTELAIFLTFHLDRISGPGPDRADTQRQRGGLLRRLLSVIRRGACRLTRKNEGTTNV